MKNPDRFWISDTAEIAHTEPGRNVRRKVDERRDPSELLAPITTVATFVAPLLLVILAYIWIRIAGQAGSPQPDNWAQLSLILRIIERSILPLFAVTVVAPIAWGALRRGRRWAAYPVPIILVLMVVAQVGLHIRDLYARQPPSEVSILGSLQL